MKFLVPIAVILALTSCSITQKVGVGNGTFAKETDQAIVVLAPDLGAEKVHLGLTGANDTFKPAVSDVPNPVDATKFISGGTCKVTNEKFNIWNCDLGVMKGGDVRKITFEGKLLSGNYFGYELSTQKILLENVKVR